MRRILLAFFSVFVFASCLISGSILLTGCTQTPNNAGGGF